MMKDNKFKEVGYNISQIGFYLMNMDSTLFCDNELNRNIVSLLAQMSLYLNDNLGKPLIELTEVTEEKKYLSKTEAIELYHPLLTEYSLTQSIKKNEIKYIKRGAKYFFLKEDLQSWVDDRKLINSNQSIRTTTKFV